MYSNIEQGVDAGVWLKNFDAPAPAVVAPAPLSQRSSTEEMPDDADRLKKLIRDMQFENDLIRRVNKALVRHILSHREWRITGYPTPLTDPFDITPDE